MGGTDRILALQGADGRLLLVVLAVAVAAMALLGPAKASGTAVVGTFGSPGGGGNGQLSGPRGLGVNHTGAGGASVGDVYVTDSGNNRIAEFSAGGTFVRAWGVDVVSSGPDDTGTTGFEVCLPVDVCKAGTPSAVAGGMNAPLGLAIDQANGNVYVIDANGNSFQTNSRVNVYSAKGVFEGSFGWHVNATNPEEKLQFCTSATGCQKGTIGHGNGQFAEMFISLPAVDPGNGHLYVPDGGTIEEFGNHRVDEFVPVLNGAGEVTGISFVRAFAWDVVLSGPDQSNEVQKIRVKATSGKFKLTFGANTTGELDFNAAPGELQSALNHLASVEAIGMVKVTGGPGDANGTKPYTVVFEVLPKGANVSQMSAVKGSLSGGNPTAVETETYSDGGKGLEACVPAAGDVCQEGSEGGRLGQFSEGNPTSVSVDSSGSIYAVNQSRLGCVPEPSELAPCRVYKFAPSGDQVEEFAPKQLSNTSDPAAAVSPTDVAVNPENDHVLVAKKDGTETYKFFEFESTGASLGVVAELHSVSNPNQHGLAIGINDRFYFSDPTGKVNIFGPPPSPTVTILPPTNVGTTTATLKGTVTPPPGLHLQTTYHFELSRNGISWSRFPASDVDVGDGSGSGSPTSCPIDNPPTCEVTQAATGLEPNADYLVRLVGDSGAVATSSSESFTTTAAPPSVFGMVATAVGKTSANLTGFVNPNNQPTTYHIEWGTTTAYGNNVPNFDAFAGAGGQAGKVTAPINGLAEGTRYHFRIVAENAAGKTIGVDQEFTTLNEFSLPDGRGPEQVSANDKRPVGLIAQLLSDQIAVQAAPDGNSTLYPVLNGLADSTAGGNVEYLARRGASGWVSTQISAPSLIAAPPSAGAQPSHALFYSPDLSCGVVSSFEPLTADTPAEDIAKGVTNLYLRSDDGAYTLLTTPVPTNANEVPLNPLMYHVDGIADDCSHVLFDTKYRLLPEAPAGPNAVLYEWADGILRVPGRRPDESVASDAVAGGSSSINSISSSDGSRVFFSATSNAGGDTGKTAVFVRKNATETVDASQSHTGIANNGGSKYQMATEDGGRVLFTARYGLATNGSSSGPTTCDGGSGEGCDLYSYDVGSSTLSDLSVDTNAGDLKGAGVVGVLDASDDGSYVYFAARGRLVPLKGNTEAQNLAGAGFYNVYLNHDGAISFVGLVGQEEMTSAVGLGSDNVALEPTWVSDATPTGAHLLFVSRANVTGYDSGGKREAYLYSAASGKTVCVSCRTDGLPAEPGLTDFGGEVEPIAAHEQHETLGDGPANNSLRPRSISDDGSRVFFKMYDALTPGAVDGRRNFYEWENGQVYLLAIGEGGRDDVTEYLDAGANGDDVFLRTAAKLVPQDFDNTTDVYDLRAPHAPGEKVGPDEVVPPFVPCDPLADEAGSTAKSCLPPAVAQPEEPPTPPSEGFSGPGNLSPAKPKPPPHKKKRHHRRHRGSHGRHHHKRAAHREGRPVR